MAGILQEIGKKGIFGGAASLGSAIYGAVASSIANNKARKMIGDQRAENRRWYETKMDQDYTQRSDAQAVFNKQRELLNDKYKQAKATQAVSGGSDASVALQKEAANDAMAQTMSDVAANAANYRDSVEQQYRAQDAQLNQQQAASYQQQGAATAAAAGQAVNAGINLMGASMKQNEDKAVKAAEQAYDLAQATKDIEKSTV